MLLRQSRRAALNPPSLNAVGSRLVRVIALAALLPSCAVVVSDKPIGAEALSIEAEDWEGTWWHTDGAIEIIVADAAKGILRLAWVEKTQNEAQLEIVDVLLRRTGDWSFASYLVPGEGEPGPGYYFARVRNEDDIILAWPPDPARFKKLVEDGKLPGTLEGKERDTVQLQALKLEHLELMASEREGVLFGWETPIVLHRISAD